MVLSQTRVKVQTHAFIFFPPTSFFFSPNKSSCNDRYTPCHVFLGKSDGVFSHHCFASRCVCSYKHRIVVLQPEYGLLLENIQLKWPLIKNKQTQIILYKEEHRKQYDVVKENDATPLERWVGDAFIEIVAG